MHFLQSVHAETGCTNQSWNRSLCFLEICIKLIPVRHLKNKIIPWGLLIKIVLLPTYHHSPISCSPCLSRSDTCDFATIEKLVLKAAQKIMRALKGFKMGFFGHFLSVFLEGEELQRINSQKGNQEKGEWQIRNGPLPSGAYSPAQRAVNSSTV